MKVCIINSSPRFHSNTKEAVSIIQRKLESLGDVTFEEYNLNKDFPVFCKGCYTCIFGSETKCPHYSLVAPITESLKTCDALIVSSPVYVMSMTGYLKSLFDHYGWAFMVHRPMKELFAKHALVVSTAAGAGMGKTNKSIKTILDYLGFRSVDTLGIRILAENFEDMKEKRKQKAKKSLEKKATHLFKKTVSPKKTRVRLFTRIMFSIGGKLVHKMSSNPFETAYWKENGWLNGKTPF